MKWERAEEDLKLIREWWTLFLDGLTGGDDQRARRTMIVHTAVAVRGFWVEGYGIPHDGSEDLVAACQVIYRFRGEEWHADFHESDEERRAPGPYYAGKGAPP